MVDVAGDELFEEEAGLAVAEFVEGAPELLGLVDLRMPNAEASDRGLSSQGAGTWAM